MSKVESPADRAKSEACNRLLTFVTKNAQLHLRTFEVFGDYVCFDSQLHHDLIYLYHDLSIKINRADLHKPINIFLCAHPGAGKTYMVRELSRMFTHVPFVYTRLSDCATIDDGFEQHIAEILPKQSTSASGVVLACLDEVDIERPGENIYQRLLGPMGGDEFEFGGSDPISLKSLVWFFLASCCCLGCSGLPRVLKTPEISVISSIL